MSAKRGDIPPGFEPLTLDVSGSLRKRSGVYTILVSKKHVDLYGLKEGDELIARVVAIRKVRSP